MTDHSLKFLHAGAFRLDEPLEGLVDLPPEWLDLLADAPYAAAQNVFATALAEDVDFVILVGKLLDPHRSGPRGMAFLLDHFDQLAAKNIPIYWASDDADHWDRWPNGCQLPENVHVFSHGHVEETVFQRGGESVATLLGRSGSVNASIKGAEFNGDFGRFTIGLSCGKPDKKSLSRHTIDYWALSSRNSRETYFSKPRHAHDAGTPQGRSDQDLDAHGSTIVRVANGRTALAPSPCDAVRWSHVAIEAPRPATLESLENAIDEHASRMLVDSDRPQLVVWNIQGVERLEGAGRDGRWRDDLAARLRKRHGAIESGLWTVRIDATLPDAPNEQWLDENTMLGDFLRELQDYSFRSDAEKALRDRLVELGISSEIHEYCDLSDKSEQQLVLAEASKLGADLLRGKA